MSLRSSKFSTSSVSVLFKYTLRTEPKLNSQKTYHVKKNKQIVESKINVTRIGSSFSCTDTYTHTLLYSMRYNIRYLFAFLPFWCVKTSFHSLDVSKLEDGNQFYKKRSRKNVKRCWRVECNGGIGAVQLKLDLSIAALLFFYNIDIEIDWHFPIYSRAATGKMLTHQWRRDKQTTWVGSESADLEQNQVLPSGRTARWENL